MSKLKSLLALYPDLPAAKAWVLCEPIELTEQKRDVVCLGNAHLEITLEEAQAFAATFNTYWEGTGLVMHTPTPTQWLLALPAHDTKIETRPLSEVLNQSIGQTVPSLFLQAQMLMQAHPVNRARAGRLPKVNALWISAAS